MRKSALTDHAAAKRAAQHILSNGLATYAEIAAITGRSRQVIRLWARQLDVESARERHLNRIWREAIKHEGTSK